MRFFLSMLLLACLVASFASTAEARLRRIPSWEAQPVQYVYPGANARLYEKKDGASGYNEDYFTDLPQGQDKLHLTLITGDNWQSDPKQAAVASWMEHDPRLAAFRQQCHWHWYTHSNPHFHERLRKRVGDAVPQIVLQMPDGAVLLNVSKSMPRTSGELADMINASVEVNFAPPTIAGSESHIIRESAGDCPDGNCPPRPDLSVTPSEVIDEVVPKPAQSGMTFLVAVGIVCCLIYAVIRVVARRDLQGGGIDAGGIL